MDIRWFEGQWWIYVDGEPECPAIPTEVFAYAAVFQYDGLPDEPQNDV